MATSHTTMTIRLMRVLVCGSRSFSDRDVIHRDLDALVPVDDGRLIVINGFAIGADRMADEWASAHDRAQPWRFAADWETCVEDCLPGHRRVNSTGREYCPHAGLRRNQRMLDEGKPQVVLAYVNKPLSESRGTADMVRRAEAAGIPVHVREVTQ